jgi:hypothetical protein
MRISATAPHEQIFWWFRALLPPLGRIKSPVTIPDSVLQAVHGDDNPDEK